MSTAATSLDRMVFASCGKAVPVQVAKGQTKEATVRPFAEVQAEVQVETRRKAYNNTVSDDSDQLSVESQESADVAGEVRPQEQANSESTADVGSDDGSGPVLVAEATTEAGAPVDGDSSMAADGRGHMEGAAPSVTSVQQQSLQPEVYVPGELSADDAALIRTAAIGREGAKQETLTPMNTDEASASPGGGSTEGDRVFGDWVAGETSPRGDASPSTVEAGSDGVAMADNIKGGGVETGESKDLTEGAIVHGETEAVVRGSGVNSLPGDAATGADRTGATAQEGGPQRVEAEAATPHEVEAGTDRRQDGWRRDPADDVLSFTQHIRTDTSEGGEKQAGGLDFNPGVQVDAELEAATESSSSPSPAQIPQRFAGPEGAGEARVSDSASNVSDQMLDSIRASLTRGDRSVVIRLHPPELGSVVVRLQGDQGRIEGVLEVGKADTRYEIEQALPQVLRGLQDSGIQIRRFEVTVADEPPERELAKEGAQEDGSPQQQGPRQEVDDREGGAGTERAVRGLDHQGAVEYVGGALPAVGQATDHIDMLV